MAVIDSTKKEINFKIVYYGPAESGKTTTLQELHSSVKSKKKSEVTKASKTERTIFFDFLALKSDSIGGYKTRFQVYTVPGQPLYEDSRRLLLKGVDGIIFVADAQLDRIQDNLNSLEELKVLLHEMGYTPQEIPMVIQLNKVDLPNIPPIDELRKAINIFHVPDFETIATTGSGVHDAFRECVRQVLMTLKDL
ncbi:MAG: hypothetical protein A3G32_01135 [Deltaproteobacteria bacterium RIFCSPLOWO2_12_FULL_40_28]|nr:MAG: hypothetical protein A3C45_10020 [Deltaproteobacteria bacterium RIFCSPHIGHO2_02_FULL_40_28]OGQ19937.1 MAG: hypothetical protein A3E27_06970 [Deltaproteobacteria bacterium RIFCSPHIGHO2_12_FULL_40_32]OGQ39696.1 MAG: hypothetical protein A3I69_06400 [Deltaproteobacteria bacterium RIFCSPLOWO2_02_FULL_40_36]OGQ52952.1 MAG: hypothetical protein A3G32_01135 [Deltaproteobacteria bacterium RIFCSPLOWO2_12_FULL_40_28]